MIRAIKEDEVALAMLCYLGWDKYTGSVGKLAKNIPMTLKRLYSILSKWRKYGCWDNGLTNEGKEWVEVISKIEYINNHLDKIEEIMKGFSHIDNNGRAKRYKGKVLI